jgi:EamA domain-containing membrane protein RarD
VSAVSRDQIVGFLAVGTAASIWGTLGLFAKILYAEGVSFEALVAVRASLGWTAMLLFVLLRRGAGSLQVARRDLLFLGPLGILGIGAFYWLYFFTVRESTVGTAAILLYSSPAFVALLAWIFLKETLGLLRLLALTLTFGGIFLEGVMNSAEKPHWDADSSVRSVLRRSPVFRISKPFLSKFITPSRGWGWMNRLSHFIASACSPVR